MVQPLIKQACDMVHREQFTASSDSLGLLEQAEPRPSPGQRPLPEGASTSQPQTKSHKSKSQPNQKTKYIQVID